MDGKSWGTLDLLRTSCGESDQVERMWCEDERPRHTVALDMHGNNHSAECTMPRNGCMWFYIHNPKPSMGQVGGTNDVFERRLIEG